MKKLYRGVETAVRVGVTVVQRGQKGFEYVIDKITVVWFKFFDQGG